MTDAVVKMESHFGPLDSGSCKVSQGRTLNAAVTSRVPPLTAKPRAPGELARAASCHSSGEAEGQGCSS